MAVAAATRGGLGLCNNCIYAKQEEERRIAFFIFHFCGVMNLTAATPPYARLLAVRASLGDPGTPCSRAGDIQVSREPSAVLCGGHRGHRRHR